MVQAEEDTEVEPDHVYIIQPGKMMTIKKGHIHYTDQIPKELNLPIDAFFRSLAEGAGHRAIAVVLSGTGSEGTNGIEAIKEAEAFELRSVLDNVSVMLEPRIEEAKVSFEMSIDDDFNPKYVGSKTKLQQILINLLNNSAKYTKAGGAISLRVFEEPGEGKRSRVCFVVTDNGMGIKKKYLSKLFKPFTREDAEDGAERISVPRETLSLCALKKRNKAHRLPANAGRR